MVPVDVRAEAHLAKTATPDDYEHKAATVIDEFVDAFQKAELKRIAHEAASR